MEGDRAVANFARDERGQPAFTTASLPPGGDRRLIRGDLLGDGRRMVAVTSPRLLDALF